MTKKSTLKFLALILAALLFRFFVLEPYQISNSQMAPTLLKKDYLIVKKYIYGLRLPFFKRYFIRWASPKRGEVVLFSAPHQPQFLSVLRVVAVPGDTLIYSQNVLKINGKKYAPEIPASVQKEKEFLRSSDFVGEFSLENLEAYTHWQEELSDKTGPYSILQKNQKTSLSFGPYQIPEGFYFVMGDHRFQADDSRTWPAQGNRNLVPFNNIQGRAFKILWGCEKTLPVLFFLCQFDSFRKGRLFYPVHKKRKDLK